MKINIFHIMIIAFIISIICGIKTNVFWGIISYVGICWGFILIGLGIEFLKAFLERRK